MNIFIRMHILYAIMMFRKKNNHSLIDFKFWKNLLFYEINKTDRTRDY
jgi:hypothetical protein